MSYDGEFDTAVLGGLKVTVRYEVDGEYHSDGYLQGHYSWWIHAINGKVCKKQPEWLIKRIRAEGYDDLIVESCRDDYNSGAW